MVILFITKSCAESKETIKIDGSEYPLIKREISSTSHPFYTGKMKLVDTAGRVDKFYKKFGKSAFASKSTNEEKISSRASSRVSSSRVSSSSSSQQQQSQQSSRVQIQQQSQQQQQQSQQQQSQQQQIQQQQIQQRRRCQQ